MIKVYYTYTGLANEAELIKRIGPLPEKMRMRLEKYRKVEDRLLMLAALFLLKEALEENGHFGYQLQHVRYTPAGKPFFDGAAFDFSISHTEGCALVAFSDESRVGADIEKIKAVDFADFETVFSPELWAEIMASPHRENSFYGHWTLLESAVKADGRGLPLISSNQLKISDNQVIIGSRTWFCYPLKLAPSVSCCIASNQKQETIDLTEVKLV